MRVRLASSVTAALSAVLLSLVVLTGLTGCSPLGTASGADALAHLTTAVDASVAKFESEGGTETLTANGQQTLLIYDPSAPAGERAATANLNDASVPLFTDEQAISIRALASILQDPKVVGADFSEKANRFRIAGDQFVIEVIVENGLVTQSAVVGAAFGTKDPQSVLTTYGLSDDVKKLFATAQHPTTK